MKWLEQWYAPCPIMHSFYLLGAASSGGVPTLKGWLCNKANTTSHISTHSWKRSHVNVANTKRLMAQWWLVRQRLWSHFGTVNMLVRCVGFKKLFLVPTNDDLLGKRADETKRSPWWPILKPMIGSWIAVCCHGFLNAEQIQCAGYVSCLTC